MSALGNEELMEAILDAVRKVKVKFQERQEVSDSLFGDVPALPHSIAQLKESLGRAEDEIDTLPSAKKKLVIVDDNSFRSTNTA